jgi:hypothetical protein
MYGRNVPGRGLKSDIGLIVSPTSLQVPPKLDLSTPCLSANRQLPIANRIANHLRAIRA